MATKKTSQSFYTCDFYHKDAEIPYRTSTDMSWEDVKREKRIAKALGDKVVHEYAYTIVH